MKNWKIKNISKTNTYECFLFFVYLKRSSYQITNIYLKKKYKWDKNEETKKI